MIAEIKKMFKSDSKPQITVISVENYLRLHAYARRKKLRKAPEQIALIYGLGEVTY